MALSQLAAYDWRQGPDPSPAISLGASRKADLVPQWPQDRAAARLKKQLRSSLFLIVGSKDRVAQRFNEYVSQWRKDTLALSSIPEKVSHASYLKIIALRVNPTPLILRELRDRPAHWFVALEALNEDGPRGTFPNFDAQRTAWLTWGVNCGYIGGFQTRTLSNVPKAQARKSQKKKSIRSKL